MRNKKEKILALSFALVVHALLLLLLWFVVLKPQQMRDNEGGVPVDIGEIEVAMASDMDSWQTNQIEPQPIPQMDPAPQADEDDLLTQDNDETVPMKVPPKKSPVAKKKKEKNETPKQKLPNERKQREEAAKIAEKKAKAAAQFRISNAFSNAKAKASKGSGDEGQGIQGSPDGNVQSGGKSSGVGGYGSWELGGRSLGAGLPRPSYTAQVEGTIVLNIIVNPEGRVIEASIGPGTNIDNQSLRRSAIRAAKQARFNAVSGIQNQKGRIIYRFRLKS